MALNANPNQASASASTSNSASQASASGAKKYEPPTVTEVWDEQIGTRGVYLLELG